MRRYDRPSRGEPTLARCAVVSPPPLDGLFPVFVMQTLAEASWREPIKAAREPTRTDERAKSRRERTGGEEKQPSQPAKHLSFFCFFSPYTERSSSSFSLPLVYRRLFPIPRLHSSLLISICTRAPSLPQRAHGITVQESVSRVHFSRLTCSHEAMRGEGGAREEASSMPGSLLSHGLMPVSAVSVPPNNR